MRGKNLVSPRFAVCNRRESFTFVCSFDRLFAGGQVYGVAMWLNWRGWMLVLANSGLLGNRGWVKPRGTMCNRIVFIFILPIFMLTVGFVCLTSSWRIWYADGCKFWVV